MKKVFIKKFIILVHAFLCFVLIGAAFYGFRNSKTFVLNGNLLVNIATGLAITLFAFAYYISLSDSISENSPFLSLYFLFLQLAIIAITATHSSIVSVFGVPQIIISEMIIFCAIFMNLMLLGYGFFAHNKAISPIHIFLFGSFVISLITSSFIPKIQGSYNFWDNIPALIFFSIGSVSNIVVFMVLIISDPPGSQNIRSVLGLILSTFTWIFFSFDSVLSGMICTDILVVALLVVFIICKKNSIKL